MKNVKKDSAVLQQFLAHYKDYIKNVLQPTEKELGTLLKSWRQPEYWSKYTTNSLPIPSPTQRYRIRIKRAERAIDKLMRKPEEFPKGLSPESLPLMDDALGARVVVYFLGHLPLIDRTLRDLEKLKQIEISKKTPPVAYLTENHAKRWLSHLERRDKESGYASVHYILRLKESRHVAKNNRPWFELQVRTLAQDIWGEIEHRLGYKPKKKTLLAVRKQFYIISTHLRAIDEHFNFLYDELSRFQEEVKYEESDPLNAENLPNVLSDILSIGVAQFEIGGILKIFFSRGIETVANLREIVTRDRLDIIHNTYISESGRKPKNFEVIATLATLTDIKNSEEEVKMIKAHIAYAKVWETLSKEGLT